MSSGHDELNHTAGVTDLDAVRARRSSAHPSAHDVRERRPRTVILRVSHVRADAEAHRQIGVDDSLTLKNLCSVIGTAFRLPHSAPWTLHAGNHRLPLDMTIAEVLGDTDSRIGVEWGLWQFRVETVDSWPRDAGTPWALCIGGSGDFADQPFDITEINRELTGASATDAILAATRPEVVDLIERAQIHDFIPLLQALDLARDTGLPRPVRDTLARLPVEEDPAARDAFWVCALALASLADETLAHDILEGTMQSLGWGNDDGSPLTAQDVRELCLASLRILAEVGGYGDDALPTLERLDIYRQLLGSGHTAG